jgi:alkylation response protein AidB-like acyl-CoA dehydrogenase
LVCDYISGATIILDRFGAHTGTMPITLYGTEEQNKNTPKLASGEWFGAYCH